MRVPVRKSEDRSSKPNGLAVKIGVIAKWQARNFDPITVVW